MSSVCSPTSSLTDEDQMSTFMSLQDEEDLDLAMKAPYIPMDINDDLPLLIPDDLMWNSNVKTNNKRCNENSSSLAQLLCSNINKSNVNNVRLKDLLENGK